MYDQKRQHCPKKSTNLAQNNMINVNLTKIDIDQVELEKFDKKFQIHSKVRDSIGLAKMIFLYRLGNL